MANDAPQTLIDWLQDSLENYAQERELILARMSTKNCSDAEKETLNKLLAFMAEDMCRLRRALAPVDRSQIDGLGIDLPRPSSVDSICPKWTPATIPPPKHGKYLVVCESMPGVQIRLFDGMWDTIRPVIKWMPCPPDT